MLNKLFIIQLFEEQKRIYKMKYCVSFILLTLLLVLSSSKASQSTQQCLDEKGSPVDWWVILAVPGGGTHKYPGYGYYDSNDHKAGRKQFHVNKEGPDNDNTALGKTFNQIKKKDMSVVAWNDQACKKNPPQPKDIHSPNSPNGHSKAVGAYDSDSKRGFFISHSIPYYPCFNDHQIDIKINPKQQKYGQDLFCISGNEKFIKNMISKVPPMLPKFYQQNYNCKQLFGQKQNKKIQGKGGVNDCSKLFGSNGINMPDFEQKFSEFQYKIGGVQFKMIFKNGIKSQKYRSSIFQNVSQILESSIVHQTWNASKDEIVCSKKYKSQKVKQMHFNKLHNWKTANDHSKWLIATQNDYVCYGDLNRNSAQQKRGGAFYCLNSKGLNTAMKRLINCDNCQSRCCTGCCVQSCQNSSSVETNADDQQQQQQGQQQGQEQEQQEEQEQQDEDDQQL